MNQKSPASKLDYLLESIDRHLAVIEANPFCHCMKKESRYGKLQAREEAHSRKEARRR